MAVLVAWLCGIGLAVLGAAVDTESTGHESCSASGGACEELGLLQQTSAQRARESNLKPRSASASLQFMQWNVGHPKKVEKQSVDYVNSTLCDGALDFFNVINLKGVVLPSQYSEVASDCSKDDQNVDVTTLIYNKQRWKLDSNQSFCLSKGSDAALVARFTPRGGGPKLVVAGAHFATSSGTRESEYVTFKQRLEHPADYKVVFIGDTNECQNKKNEDLAVAWGIDVGTSTPTEGTTAVYPILSLPASPYCGFSGPHWNADRIITSLPGPTTPVPVDIKSVSSLVKPTLFGMHNPIRLTL